MYSAAQIANLEVEYPKVGVKHDALMQAFVQRAYRTERGKEFATHGFLRRLKTMRHCIEMVFDRLPPEIPDIPQKNALEDALVALQAFIFNVFGCADNLAWLWVEEKGVTKQDGTALPANWVGLGTKYQTVRASFSQPFRDYLATRQPWFVHLENYRHALAHRIPLYIPPFRIDPANEAAFTLLQQQIFQARLNGDEQIAAQLEAQQLPLKSFYPVMKHSFSENNAAIVIHPQMLVDFFTVDELASKMLDELATLAGP